MRKGRKTPSRTCVGCGRVREKRELLRITISGNTARVDPKGRLPGRGLYVCREEACVAVAEKRRGFSRWIAADEAVRLFAAVREALGGGRADGDERVLALVGLARRAGFVEVGLRNVLAALARGDGRVVVMARDISQRGGLVVTRAAHEHEVPQVVVGTRVLLGVALGAGETVAALVVDEHSALGIVRAAAPTADAVVTSGSIEPEDSSR